MPRNVFEEEENVPINKTDSSAVKLSSSAEIREKKQRICFPSEPVWEVALVISMAAQLLGRGCGATSVRGFGGSFVLPVPGVGWRPPNTCPLSPSTGDTEPRAHSQPHSR